MLSFSTSLKKLLSEENRSHWLHKVLIQIYARNCSFGLPASNLCKTLGWNFFTWTWETCHVGNYRSYWIHPVLMKLLAAGSLRQTTGTVFVCIFIANHLDSCLKSWSFLYFRRSSEVFSSSTTHPNQCMLYCFVFFTLKVHFCSTNCQTS